MTPFISLGIKLQRFVYTLSRYVGNLMIVDKFSHFYHTLFKANRPSPSYGPQRDKGLWGCRQSQTIRLLSYRD